MTLSLQQLQHTIVRYEWSAGNATGTGGTNQFLYPAQQTGAAGTSEVQSQRRPGLTFGLWRLATGFTRGTPTSQATVTVRINGVSQGSTATVIGTAIGMLLTDLAAAILVIKTDLLAILLVTVSTDAGTTHPVAQVIGDISSTF